MEGDTVDKNKKNEILYHAERVLYFNNMLIKQCDSWLSAEEGNANMMKTFMEKHKREAQLARTKRWNTLLRFFGFKKEKKEKIIR